MSVPPPRFSIVIPCYNQGAFLAECLESLRAQTLPPFEIIVVDDGSTDAYSVQRMDELCVDGVKLIRQENRGLSGARNTAVRAATGDWILPLDADDRVEPQALAAYARAIAGAPEVDVWYPDIHYFGNESSIWQCFHFNPWRQLWENQMTCSSAIRRSVFDAGVFYNERMRQGYEDWEFFIHACAERGFVARSLGEPVFRYRRWGYSMLSASDSKRDELVAQLHRERPIYQDEERLLRLKRQHNPFLGVAADTPELAAALEGQRFQDFRVVDDTGRVTRHQELSVFHGVPCSRVLVSLDDAPLSAALRADPFLLEKVARTLQNHNPSVLWLVTTGPEGAWPGLLLSEHEARSPQVRCVGFCLAPMALIEAPDIPLASDSLVADLAQHVADRVPHSTLTLVVGPHLSPSEGVPRPGARARQEPPPPPPPPAPASVLSERRHLFRLGALLIGKGVNRLAQGALGAQAHERLLQTGAVRGLRSWLVQTPPPAPPAPPRSPGPGPGPMRAGPLSQAVKTDARSRNTHGYVLTCPPRFSEPQPAAGPPPVLLAVPSLAAGPESRAFVQLVQDLARQSPQQRRYLLVTQEERHGEPLAHAPELLPHLAGVFCLPSLSPRAPGEELARLVQRLGAGSVLIADSRVAFEALPALRRLPNRVRLVAQAHSLRGAPVPEHASACAYAAARFNNLLDAYVVSFQAVAEQLVRDFYVSESKVHVVPAGVELARALSRRPPLEGGRPPRVLWFHPPEAGDGVHLRLLDVARLWKQRHVGQAPVIQAVTHGPVADWLLQALKQHQLSDMVQLSPDVKDLLPLHAEADCLVLPAATPGQALLALEAMAAGTPVVAAPGTPELTSRLAWALEDPERPVEYLRTLEYLLDEPERVRAQAELARVASTAQEPRGAALRQLEALLLSTPAEPVRQRAAS